MYQYDVSRALTRTRDCSSNFYSICKNAQRVTEGWRSECRMAGMPNSDFDSIGRNAEWRCWLIGWNDSKYLQVVCWLCTCFGINRRQTLQRYRRKSTKRRRRSLNWKPKQQSPLSLSPPMQTVQDQGNSSVISAEEWDILQEIVRRDWREMPHAPTRPPHGEFNQTMFAISEESRQGPASTWNIAGTALMHSSMPAVTSQLQVITCRRNSNGKSARIRQSPWKLQTAKRW